MVDLSNSFNVYKWPGIMVPLGIRCWICWVDEENKLKHHCRHQSSIHLYSIYTVKSIYPRYESKTYKNIKSHQDFQGAAIALSLAVTVRDLIFSWRWNSQRTLPRHGELSKTSPAQVISPWPWNYLGRSAMAGSAESDMGLFDVDFSCGV